MATSPRLLLLMRHAEAMNLAPGLGDIDRPLTEDGREQAEYVGRWLSDQEFRIDHVLCSPAVRTRETAEALGVDAPIELIDMIYNAGSDSIRDEVARVDDTSGCLLVIGHAPGVPALVDGLADPAQTDPQTMQEVNRGFPGATLVGIEVGGTWADLTPGRLAFVLRGS